MSAADGEELSEGWTVAALPDVCDLNPQKPKATEFADDLPVTFVPMPAVDADAGAITNPSTRPFGEVRKGFTSFRDGDVILAKITPCMENGKAAVARGLTNGLGFGSTEFHVLRSNGSVLPDYVYYFIRQESFRKAAEAEMTGSVGQKRVPAEYLGQVEVPLPPLAEQQRIVAAVERLLGRVSAARDRLNRVPATLKRFRQAVLAAACSGRLTADWRTDNPNPNAELDLATLSNRNAAERTRAEPTEGREIIAEQTPESWRIPRIEEVFRIIDYRGKNPKKSSAGKRLITAKNIRLGFIADEPVEYISDSIYVRWMTRGFPKKGDIVFVTEGATMGFAALNDRDDEIALAQRTLTLQPLASLDTRLFLYFILSTQFQKLIALNATGSAAVGIKGARFRDLPIPFPPFAEQREIVRRVGELFAKADAIEAKVAAARRRVEGLTQAVLAKAFRGELVPTEAELARREGRDYEPASALLERIRAERPTPKTRGTRNRFTAT
jgi:type I restriction enzyme S subunit